LHVLIELYLCTLCQLFLTHNVKCFLCYDQLNVDKADLPQIFVTETTVGVSVNGVSVFTISIIGLIAN